MLSLAQHHREGCGHRIWGEGRNAGSCASVGPGVGAVCRTGSQSPHQLGRSALCLQGAWTQARVLSGEARPVQGTEPEAGGGTSFRISRMRKDVCGVLAYFLLDSSPVQWGWGLGSQWPCRVAEGRVCVLGAVSSRWPPLVQPLDTQERRSGPLQVPASLNRARGPVCQKPRTVGQQQRGTPAGAMGAFRGVTGPLRGGPGGLPVPTSVAHSRLPSSAPECVAGLWAALHELLQQGQASLGFSFFLHRVGAPALLGRGSA